MTAAELLAKCSALDIILQPHGDWLDIDAPLRTLTSELKAQLREHKAELLALLRPPPATQPQLMPAMKPSGKPLRRCGSTTSRDVQIHEGQSVRRDCAGCGRFIAFPVWYGKPAKCEQGD